MNREIKFKVWDTEFNEFTEYHKNRALVTEINKCDRFVFLQFTGLHDKNGVEIYEGDVLKFMHHLHKVFRVNGGLVINSHLDDFYKETTPFYEGCANMQTSQWINQCEVIGNIYLNPEILIKPNWA